MMLGNKILIGQPALRISPFVRNWRDKGDNDSRERSGKHNQEKS
jgi:hypothetical protein